MVLCGHKSTDFGYIDILDAFEGIKVYFECFGGILWNKYLFVDGKGPKRQKVAIFLLFSYKNVVLGL